MDGTFNIRVYGLCVREGYILLSDEVFQGIEMTKFPGGGLEYGEGTVACLYREFEEEHIGSIRSLSHYYTTDFFQAALFFEKTQLLSIYYLVDLEPRADYPVCSRAQFSPGSGGQQLRWVHLQELRAEDMTFPIDRKVVELLKSDAALLP